MHCEIQADLSKEGCHGIDTHPTIYHFIGTHIKLMQIDKTVLVHDIPQFLCINSANTIIINPMLTIYVFGVACFVNYVVVFTNLK